MTTEHKFEHRVIDELKSLLEFAHHDHKKIDHIHHELLKLVEKMHHMSIEIDALKAQAATTIQLETQVITILQAGGGTLPSSDLAQVAATTVQLKTSSDALAAALAATGGGGGASTETTDAQHLITAAQQARTVASDPEQVAGFVTQMQASAASLSLAFTRNSPPLSAAVTQQEITALEGISSLIATLSSNVNDANQVTNLVTQIMSATQSLASIIAANPRGPVVTTRRTTAPSR